MQRRLVEHAGALERLLDGFLGRFAYVGSRNLEAFTERFATLLKATEIPRDPFHLLDTLGIAVERTVLVPPHRALWTREGGGYHIYCSRHDGAPAARFSLWHEMFEILAERPRFPSALAPQAEQRLADRFAACILMPAGPLREHAAGLLTNPSCLLAVLACRFGVSLTAMRRRLRELDLPTGTSRWAGRHQPPHPALGRSWPESLRG